MAGGLATLPHPQMQERPTALEQCPQGTRAWARKVSEPPATCLGPRPCCAPPGHKVQGRVPLRVLKPASLITSSPLAAGGGGSSELLGHTGFWGGVYWVALKTAWAFLALLQEKESPV